MGKKLEDLAYEPVDLTDDAEFMDTGVLYSDRKEKKDTEQKDDVDGD